jgi:hypothetical protein
MSIINIKPKVIQKSQSLYYVICSNKKAILTKASVYHPRSNKSGSELNHERYVVSPRTAVDWIGIVPSDINKAVKGNNFICSKSHKQQVTFNFPSEEDAIIWFHNNYKFVNGYII